MDHTSTNLASNVRRLREARGLTQQKLADLSGVPRPTLAHLESGEANPTLHVLVKVAASLASPIEALIGSPRAPVRKFERSALTTRTRGGVETLDLLPDAIPGLSLERRELLSGTRARASSPGPGGRQVIACERGALEASVGQERWGLGPGDLLVVSGEVEVQLCNSGRATAVIYTISAAALGL